MEATHYQIQVNTKADFSGWMLWDSGKVKIGAPLKHGERINVKCGGLQFPSLAKKKYYWRIRFGTEKFALAWSDPAYFTTVDKSKKNKMKGGKKLKGKIKKEGGPSRKARKPPPKGAQ